LHLAAEGIQASAKIGNFYDMDATISVHIWQRRGAAPIFIENN
jgi:hypothetical protein